MVHGIPVNIMHSAVICFSYLLMFPEELFVQSVYSVKIFMMKGVNRFSPIMQYVIQLLKRIPIMQSSACCDQYCSKGSKLYKMMTTEIKVEYKCAHRQQAQHRINFSGRKNGCAMWYFQLIWTTFHLIASYKHGICSIAVILNCTDEP